MPRGLMIAIEGVDGSGKSGLVAGLAKALRGEGRHVVETREPGGTEAGVALRKLLLASDGHDWTPVSELLLMNAARRQHVDRLIRPSLEAGRTILCDRFVGSSIAYQGAGKGVPEQMIRDLHRLAIDDLWPDLTLVLDLDPVIGLARSRGRLAAGQVNEGRFEGLDLAFHQRVRRSFLEQAAALPARHIVIDADRAPAAVLEEAVGKVRARLATFPAAT